MNTAINDVLGRFKLRGHLEYGESVTQLQHALQTAILAEVTEAFNTLIAAALLHDFGYLLHAEEDADRGIDACHEESGAAYLSGLSPVYQRSLELQESPCTNAEPDAFANLPFAEEAVQLRQWDGCGKIQYMSLLPIEYFISSLKASLR